MSIQALKKENLALKLHCVLHCEGQMAGFSAFSILERADNVVYVGRETILLNHF